MTTPKFDWSLEGQNAKLQHDLERLAAFGCCYPQLVAVIQADVELLDFKSALKSLRSPRPYVSFENAMVVHDVANDLNFLRGWHDALKIQAARRAADLAATG